METDHIRVPDRDLLNSPPNARPEIPGRIPVGQVSGLSPDTLEVLQKAGAFLASPKVLVQFSSHLRGEVSVQIGGQSL
jgi:hypothetical protein